MCLIYFILLFHFRSLRFFLLSACLSPVYLPACEVLLDQVVKTPLCVSQLTQAQTGKFNVHVHVEYEWRLQNEDLDESEDEMEDKVSWIPSHQVKPCAVNVWDQYQAAFSLQPIPNRREERPVSCFVPGSGPMQPNLAALARDAACLVRDKQRPPVPSTLISNETYGTMPDLSLLPPGPTPPLPPRAPHRGQRSWGVVPY